MVIVSGITPILLEKREEAFAAMTIMAEATRKEDGCQTYSFYEDVTAPGQILVFEIWDSMEQLKAHFETTHMAEFRQKMPALVAGKGDISIYEGASVTKL